MVLNIVINFTKIIKIMFKIFKPTIEPSKQLFKGKELEVNKWDISDFIIHKLIKIVGTRPYPLDELMLMTSTLILCKPKYIIEWGTHIGKSARIFYEVAKFYKIDTQIYTYDLPDNIEHNEHPKNDRGMLIQNLKNVHAYQDDALLHGIDVLSLKNVEDHEILFYIDGDHAYDSVSMELTTIFNNYPNASILLHDTYFQTSESEYNIGPYLAIKDFLDSVNKDYKVISTNLGLPGMTLLVK